MGDVTVDRLTIGWPGSPRPALADVSFDVARGEKVALVGPNGAGKSTLIACLSGALLADPPVSVGGVPVTRRTLDDVRRRLGVVVQDADDQLFMPTVREDVAFGPLHHGVPRDEVLRRVDEALGAVGARELADRSTSALSGGEKRLVAIATVLSMRVDVLVLDEPTSNLDARGRRRVADVLSSLPQTVLVATHDLDLVRRVASRVVLLDEGRVVVDGETADILADVDRLERHGVT